MPPEARPALTRLLIPGTDADIIARYATLGERARDAVFGAFEEEVVTLDVETTGLDYYGDSIIEIAAVRLSGPEITGRFSTFVDPGRPIPPEISELTSISDADVAGAPDAQEAIGQLAEFIGGSAIVAHNCDFDRNMLRQATARRWGFIEDNDWIDSIELARISLPRCRSYGLQALTAAFCDSRSTHRAIDDCEGLAQLWRIMLTALGDLPPGLARYIADLFPDAEWPLRRFISQVAGAASERFSLVEARRARALQRPFQDKQDALELFGGRGALKPLEADELAAAFAGSGLVAGMYPAYESRQEQLDMALAIAEALNSSQHLAVEAGTGVGKSMAYLLPLALFAKRNSVCCGVATKTNALLDQLLYSELPRLDTALPGGLAFEALKGYDHYPCLRKLSGLARQSERQPSGAGIAMLASLLTFVCSSSRGDLDGLSLHFGEIKRHEVVASAEDCAKRKCSYYQSCLLHGARRAAAQADIVLTNQALLFCDVTAEGGILPDIRHWVVDEAHGAEDEARDQLSYSVSGSELAAALDALLARRGALHSLRDKALKAAAQPLAARIDEALLKAAAIPAICESFQSCLKDLASLAEQSSYDRVELWINDQVRQSGPWADLFSPAASLVRRLEELASDCMAIASEANQSDGYDEERGDLERLASELEAGQKALSMILNGDDPAYVYSAQLDRRPESTADSLTAACIEVGEALAEQLYPNTLSVIYTSATLAADDGFDYFARASGLDLLPEGSWQGRRLESSYDFDRLMAVYLPTDLPEPNQPGYQEALEELLYQVNAALGGSVLTLFTNRREMESLYYRLRDRLAGQGVRLRMQRPGYSNRRLAEEFIASREMSLFATRSFWEGFDAPGDTLRCVVIPKLPFGRPTDPLACERSLRERDSWRRYVLPQAIIDLRQAAGRLIRNSSDRGALVLADSRLLSRGYGQAFLDALPSQQRYTLDTPSIALAIGRLGDTIDEQ